jgi:hypothetical protein
MEIFGEWSFRGRGQQIAANRQQEAGSGTVSTVPFWFLGDERGDFAQRAQRKNTLREKRSGQAEGTEKKGPGFRRFPLG